MKKSFIRFVAVGGSATAIDYVIYMLLDSMLGITVSKVCSMLISSIYSYFLNKKWTFDSGKSSARGSICKYYATFVINLLINVTVNKAVFTYSGNKTFGFMIGTGTAMIVNYVLQKLWVFKSIPVQDN